MRVWGRSNAKCCQGRGGLAAIDNLYDANNPFLKTAKEGGGAGPVLCLKRRGGKGKLIESLRCSYTDGAGAMVLR